MVKLEETKRSQAIEEQVELHKQLQESLNAEKTERCAAQESSNLRMEEYKTRQETKVQHIMGLIQHEGAAQCHFADVLEKCSKQLSDTLSNELSTKLVEGDTNMRAHVAAVMK